MWQTLFPAILNMSVTAALLVPVVWLLRLALQKGPAFVRPLLWLVIPIRLLCPFSFSSPFAFLNLFSLSAGSMGTSSGLHAQLTQIRLIPFASGPDSALSGAEPDSAGILLASLTVVWAIGAAAVAAASIVSLFRLRSRLRARLHVRDNIYLADNIPAPFVLGIRRPDIYLPSTLSPEEQICCILHEQSHIRRRDPLLKLLFYTALCIHWFNPLIWLAFSLFDRDVETACDEAALRSAASDIRDRYARTLFTLTAGRPTAFRPPLFFARGKTESRIRAILRYRPRPVRVLILSAATGGILLLFLLLNPVRSAPFSGAYLLHPTTGEVIGEATGVSLEDDELRFSLPETDFVFPLLRQESSDSGSDVWFGEDARHNCIFSQDATTGVWLIRVTEKGVSAWNRGNDPAHSFYLLVGNIPEDLLLQIQKMISSPAAISSRRCPLC